MMFAFVNRLIQHFSTFSLLGNLGVEAKLWIFNMERISNWKWRCEL